MRQGLFAIAVLGVLSGGCYREAPAPSAYVPKTYAAEKNAQALAALRAGDAAAALPLIDAAVEHDPKFPAAHLNRGIVLAALGRFEEAAASAEAGVALEPRNPQAHVFRGVFLEKAGRPSEARACYASAVELFGDAAHPDLALNRAIALYLARGPLEGAKAINDLLVRFPHYPPALALKKPMLDGDRAFFLDRAAAQGLERESEPVPAEN